MENPGFPGVKAEVTFLLNVNREHSKKYSKEICSVCREASTARNERIVREAFKNYLADFFR